MADQGDAQIGDGIDGTPHQNVDVAATMDISAEHLAALQARMAARKLKEDNTSTTRTEARAALRDALAWLCEASKRETATCFQSVRPAAERTLRACNALAIACMPVAPLRMSPPLLVPSYRFHK